MSQINGEWFSCPLIVIQGKIWQRNTKIVFKQATESLPAPEVVL